MEVAVDHKDEDCALLWIILGQRFSVSKFVILGNHKKIIS